MAIQMTGVTNRHLYSVSSNFMSTANTFSISVWINAVWNGGARLSYVGMYDGGLTTPTPTTGLQIGVSSTVVGAVECWTYGGVAMVTSAVNSMTAFNNIWTLITYTFDGTTHRLYRNATLLTSSTTAVVPGVLTQVYINGYPPTGTTSETGTYQVDAYSYYSRTLSLSEITTIYNAQGARHGIVDGLLAAYDFDELVTGATVTGVVDMSGNGNTLLNTGTGTAITYAYANTSTSSNLRMVQ